VKPSSLWLLWAALTALSVAAIAVTALKFGADISPQGVDWLLMLLRTLYVPLGWLALLAPVLAAAALIFRRWPRIFLGILAFSTVAQCAILGIEAWAHSRPPKPIIERWLG